MNRKRYFQDQPSIGQLSSELRNALSLQKDMLPIWIYRMRVLGYPPGWMQAAKTSTLDIFDGKDARPKMNSPFALEDGELEEKFKYNKESLIEFHGFNAAVPKNVKDVSIALKTLNASFSFQDWLILGMPPYQKNQLLSEAVKDMSFLEPVPYKRARLDQKSPSPARKSFDDMPETLKHKFEDDVSNFDEVQDAIEINQEKKSEIETTKKESDIIDQNSNNSNASLPTIDNDSRISTDSNDRFTSEKPGNDRKIEVVSVGTPVPSSMNRCKKPSLEKWAVGMGALLHFENLPTSIGAYENKIKSVIDKVRKRFTKK